MTEKEQALERLANAEREIAECKAILNKPEEKQETMEGFTDKQNEVFGKLFGEIKKRKPLVDAKAHTVIYLDDKNFTTLYLDADTTITGTDEEIAKVEARAKYLGLQCA